MLRIDRYVVGVGAANCYIVYDESLEAVMVDPGGDEERLLGVISEKGLKLKYIMLTHGHFDHIMGVHGIKASTGAEIIIAGGDAGCLESPESSLAGRVRLELIAEKPDHIAQDGSRYRVGGLEFEYILTPGHTKGSAVIRCGQTLFTGDTLFAGDCGRCDLPGGSYAEMLDSLERLYQLEGDYDVLPGHEEETTLETERKRNRNMLQAHARADGEEIF